MIHYQKYNAVPSDDLVFRGEADAQRGTQFTCKTCHKFAFQLKGVIHELEGSSRTQFLKGLKARHAEHAKKCVREEEEEEEKETDEEEEEKKEVLPLDPTKIANWTSSDMWDQVGARHPIPADISIVSYCPTHHGGQKYLCELSNEHGSVQLLLGDTWLYLTVPKQYAIATDLRNTRVREAIVKRCTEEAIKSVLAKAKVCHSRSARGKLKRVLAEMHKVKPGQPVFERPQPTVWKSARTKAKLVVLKPTPPAVLSVFDPDAEGYSKESPMACLLPYLLHPLQRDDVEALSQHLTSADDAPHGVASSMLGDLARCVASAGMTMRVRTLLVKPAATQAWLATAWALTCVRAGKAPVRLATARTHPTDISSNATGFLEHRGSVDLSPVGSGLLCAVLADDECSSVDPVRVLALGWID